mgnify:FL=1
MKQKLNSLSDLYKIKLEGLVTNEKTDYSTPKFTQQHLEAHFSKKGRAGKVVTVIKGFKGKNEELKSLAKILKQKINTGGTVKNGEILIQGNYRDEIIDKLEKIGHRVKRVGGRLQVPINGFFSFAGQIIIGFRKMTITKPISSISTKWRGMS